jgi:hypothetical protein
MRHDDVRYAVAAREDGLRWVRKLTVTIGTAGLACCAVLFAVFGHSARSSAAVSSGGSGSGPANRATSGPAQAPVQAPAQAPAQAPVQAPPQSVSGGS